MPDSDDCVCRACGQEYLLKFGKEPSVFCDDCAQELVPELLRIVKEVARILDIPRVSAASEALLKLEPAVATVLRQAEPPQPICDPDNEGNEESN